MLNQLKDSWFSKQTELMQKRRPRRYLHFDVPIISLDKKTWLDITNPTKISTHAFFPLIKAPKSDRVYKKDPVTKVRKFEYKERPISYASHYDSLIYSWYAHQLEYFYEQRVRSAGLDESAIAYRKLGKSNIDLALETFEFIKKNPESASLALDVRGFFDNLDFAILKRAWKENLNVKDLSDDQYAIFKSVTKFAYVRRREVTKMLKVGTKSYRKSSLFLDIKLLDVLRDKNKIKSNKLKGIPQGTPISCVLSNLYMFNFDKAMLEKVKACSGLYRRYSDDILIICPKDQINEIENFAKEHIAKLKLEIQDKKTEKRFFSKLSTEGIVCVNEEDKPSRLQYLGVVFDGKTMSLRHKGYAKFERRMKKAIMRKLTKANKTKTPFFKRGIYKKYSPMGENNYVSYAIKAGNRLSSEIIKKQVERHRILKKISKKIKEGKNLLLQNTSVTKSR
jgi:hypothetical protein